MRGQGRLASRPRRIDHRLSLATLAGGPMSKKDLHQQATDEFIRHVKKGFKKAGGD